MKIGELMQALRQVQAEHGDIEVVIDANNAFHDFNTVNHMSFTSTQPETFVGSYAVISTDIECDCDNCDQ